MPPFFPSMRSAALSIQEGRRIIRGRRPSRREMACATLLHAGRFAVGNQHNGAGRPGRCGGKADQIVEIAHTEH